MIRPVLFVLLGLRLQALLLGLVLLWERGELVDLVSFGLVELLGFLVEFVQVELSDDVLLVRETETFGMDYYCWSQEPTVHTASSTVVCS